MSSENEYWRDITQRAAFASHQLIGWIFWDPRAEARHAAFGIQDGLGHYIANRAAPLAAAGVDAVHSAFYSISRHLIHFSLDLASPHAAWQEMSDARDESVREGLLELAPEICEPLGNLATELWRTVDALPQEGRVLFAAHKAWPRPNNPTVSAWLAVNALREWRGDTHWALLVTHEIDAIEAGLLHDAWMGYPKEWIPRSRGANDALIAVALKNLSVRGFVTDGAINAKGISFRQELEEKTNELCIRQWKIFGEDNTHQFLEVIEPVGARFVERINETAGPNWMPAARERRL
jgi:hypothetical protein